MDSIMDSMISEKSLNISINDILCELMVENNRLLDELLFANKCLNQLKTHLNKIHSKYETLIDCEDKQHFEVLSHPLDQLMIKCEDNETFVEKLIAEDSHRESSESTKRQSIDESIERVVRQRRPIKLKPIKKRVIRKPVVKAIKQDIKKTSEKRITKTNVNQMNDKNEDISEESDESFAEELGEESDNSYVETKKRYKPTKKYKWAKSGSISRSTLQIPDFNERQKMFDLNTNSYKCPKTECQKTFETDNGFRGHLYFHVFKCGYNGCDKEYGFRHLLRKHEMTAHSSDNPFKCEFNGCQYESRSTEYLRNHIQTHNTNKFVCDYTGCEKSFKSCGGLDLHRRGHAIEPTYKCNTDGCDEKFVNKWHRRKHEVAVHGRKPFVKPKRRCDWPGCDYEGIYLHKHILQHTGEKKFQCLWPECGKRFARVDYFKYHMNIHNNVKPYVCCWPGCTHSYANNANLHSHIKRFHTK